MVILALSTNAFETFENCVNQNISPVTFVVYNLLPWMSMKQPCFIMPLWIPGLTSPGNDADLYLRQLIDEFKELWTKGISLYDAHNDTNFSMHTALLWIINEFPA